MLDFYNLGNYSFIILMILALSFLKSLFEFWILPCDYYNETHLKFI